MEKREVYLYLFSHVTGNVAFAIAAKFYFAVIVYILYFRFSEVGGLVYTHPRTL